MKTEHGSKPIRNEQTGYQPTIDAMNQIPPQGEKVTLSDNELIKRCQDWVSKLCKSGGRAWTLRVPVDFNNDPDVLLTELSTRLGRILTASKCETVDGVILKLESLKFKIDKKQDFGGEYQVINWCNCYGDINGDPEFDDQYNPTLWQPLPTKPQ